MSTRQEITRFMTNEPTDIAELKDENLKLKYACAEKDKAINYALAGYSGKLHPENNHPSIVLLQVLSLDCGKSVMEEVENLKKLNESRLEYAREQIGKIAALESKLYLAMRTLNELAYLGNDKAKAVVKVISNYDEDNLTGSVSIEKVDDLKAALKQACEALETCEVVAHPEDGGYFQAYDVPQVQAAIAECNKVLGGKV